ncbi:MAG: RHS repeat-associated core domain-containing protein, partial [Acidobacteriota bacterium]
MRGAPLRRTIRPGPGVGGATEEVFHYDGVGRTAMAYASGGDGPVAEDGALVTQTNFAHDVHGNVLSERQFVGNVISWQIDATYDDAHNRRTLRYLSGFLQRNLSFEIDPLNRVREIRDGAADVIARYDYLGAATSRRTAGNGVVLDVAFDALKRPTAMTHRAGGGAGANLAGFEYAYGPAHEKEFERRTGLQTRGAFAAGVEPAQGVADVYRHDGLYQLTAAKLGVPDAAAGRSYDSYLSFLREERYDFDDAGNRKTVARDEPGTAGSLETYNAIGGGGYLADALNRIVSLDTTPRVHDANGNLTDDGERQFRYDYRNRLIEVRRKSDGEVLSRHGYDGLGRRVWKQVRRETAPGVFEAENLVFGYDGEQLVTEASDAGVAGGLFKPRRTWVYGNGIDEVLERQDLDADLVPSAQYFFHENALGSVHLVTDAGGNPVEKYEYDPWGKPRFFAWSGGAGGGWTETGESAIGNDRLFTGREWDAESGLYYYRARHYDPRTGRFVSPDPLYRDREGYLYARNSP